MRYLQFYQLSFLLLFILPLTYMHDIHASFIEINYFRVSVVQSVVRPGALRQAAGKRVALARIRHWFARAVLAGERHRKHAGNRLRPQRHPAAKSIAGLVRTYHQACTQKS